MDAPHVYVFTNRSILLAQPGGRFLNAGGLRRCIEQVEELAILEHSAMLRADLDGVFILTPLGEERIADPILHLSEYLIQEGITENWFSEGWAFGNGVSCHKTHAKFQTKLVDHVAGRTMEELVERDGFVDFARLKLYRVHDRTEGWEEYERRWRSGTCPQFSHYVHLTWLVAKHEIGGYGHKRILEIIEEGASPKHPEAYNSPGEPGKYFSTVRTSGTSKEAKQLLRGVPSDLRKIERLLIRRN